MLVSVNSTRSCASIQAANFSGPSSSSFCLVPATGAGKPVWAIVGRGVLLPGPLWDQVLVRAAPSVDAGTGSALEVVDGAALEAVVGDAGQQAPKVALARPTCPPVAELLGWKS